MPSHVTEAIYAAEMPAPWQSFLLALASRADEHTGYVPPEVACELVPLIAWALGWEEAEVARTYREISGAGWLPLSLPAGALVIDLSAAPRKPLPPALRAEVAGCSIAARGLWVEIVCLLTAAGAPPGGALTSAQLDELRRRAPEADVDALLRELHAAGVYTGPVPPAG